MLIVAKSMSEVNKLKILLSREFDMKDLDVAKNILGMEIRKDKTTKRLRLSQCNYVKKVLERFNMYNAKPVSTPLANHFRLSIVQCSKIDDDEKDMSKISYASVVRYLMYVMVCIRPDLAHSVSVESKFLSNPGRHNWASGSSNA
jgi:ATP-binding cassette subfamily B (MDR/TAP) protein 1